VSRNNRLIKKKIIATFAFLGFVFVGCTTYIPQSQVIPKEDLARYNPKNFSLDNTVSKSKKYRHVKNEDDWIIKAILYEQSGNFKVSNAYYKKLYHATNRDEYLLKELKTALYSGISSKNISKLEEYIAVHPRDVIAKRLLLSSYLYSKQYKMAQESSQSLLLDSKEPVDFELSANSYIFTKEYSKGIELLNEAYIRTKNENILLKITTILVNYMGKVSEATNRLEEHRLSQGCTERVCTQLIDIYVQQNKISKLQPLYAELYTATNKEIYAEKTIESFVYVKDYQGAINFLKTTYQNDTMLYALYVDGKDFKNANKLSQKLIETTKEPKWYAESAMALYESSVDKNDKAMLAEVVKRFEEAIKHGIENTVYLNYYGYTLIDKDIDVAKGIRIIKKTLEEQPDNSYYLDSLAWGEYKLKHCEEALKLMKKVVDIEGLGEEEIREHWNTINQNCKK